MHRDRGTRPASIVAFEWLFLASVVIANGNVALFFSGLWNTFPREGYGPEWGGLVIPAASLFGGAILSVMLCLFVSRRGSLAAKWALVGMFVLTTLVQINVPRALLELVGFGVPAFFVAWGLNGLALAMLFERDARAWLDAAC